MSAGEIRLFDAGTEFIATIRDEEENIVDVSEAIVKFYFDKPNGETVEKDGAFVTDGKDGKVKYVTLNTDLDQLGTWRLQAKAVWGNASYQGSDFFRFKVRRNIYS